MTMAQLFGLCNRSGISLASRHGRLSLTPANAVTVEIRAGALEHKAELLALLTPGDELAERQAIIAEGNGQVSQAELHAAVEEWYAVIRADGWEPLGMAKRSLQRG